MGRARTRNKGWPERMYRPPGRLMIYYVPPAGKPIPLGRTEAEALPKYYAITSGIAQGRNIGTIDDLIDAWIREVVPTKGTKHTQRGNMQCAKGLRAGLGHIPVAALRPMHCYQYQAARAKKAPTRANRELSALSSIMRFAIRLGLRDDNPTLKVERLKETSRERLPETWELAAIMSAGNPMLAAYIPVKVLIGFRQGDMLAIRLDQIREDGIYSKEGKTGARKVMEWSDELRAAIAIARAVPRPVSSLYLFSTRNGGQYTSDGFRSIWHRAMRKAIKAGTIRETFTEHDIRAHSATEAERTENAERARELLGHTSKKTTEKYLRGKEPIRVRPLR